MTTNDTLAAARLEAPLPPNEARAEFIRLLSEHEDVVLELANPATMQPNWCSRFTASRRAVVAAYDRDTLSLTRPREQSHEAA